MSTLEEVLRSIEQRLSTLEAKVNGPTPAPAAPRPAASTPPKPFNPDQATIRSAKSDSPPESTSASFFGLVGIVFLILAAVFFLKLTIDSGWLTPIRQISLAAIFGLGCLLLPHYAKELQDDYGALLSGAGAVILHLTWFGAFALHLLISSDTALVMATGVGALSILLNARLGNAVFALISIAGTYLAAPLIGYKTGDFAGLSAFFLIWNVSFSALGFALKRRDILLIAAFFAVLTVGFFALHLQPLGPELAYHFLVQQCLQFAVFASAMMAYSLTHRDPLPLDQSWLLAFLLLVYYAVLYSLLETLAPGIAPWISIAFSLGVLLLFRFAQSTFPKELPSTNAIMAFATLTLLHSLYFRITPEEGKPLFSLGLALLLGVLYQRPISPVWLIPSRVLLGVVAYGAMLSFLGNFSSDLALLYHFAYGAVALFIVGALGRTTRSDGESLGSLMLGFAHLEMLVGLYRLSLRVNMSGSLFVSISWGLYALAVLLWAMNGRNKTTGKSAVLILAAVSIKAAFYDVPLTGNFARVGSLLFAGILLYVCGWIFQKMQGWEKA